MTLLITVVMVLSLQNSVGQLYFLSCSGPGVTQAGMAALQCQANPPNCGEDSVVLNTTVSAYVTALNAIAPPSPTEGVCFVNIIILYIIACSYCDSILWIVLFSTTASCIHAEGGKYAYSLKAKQLAVDEKMKEVNSSIRTKLSFFPIQQKGQKGETGDATFGAVSP